ncbi:carboxypeptidase S [Abortiporus biennis]|nr:carboxypeptidase S [Abortiporus biennis]
MSPFRNEKEEPLLPSSCPSQSARKTRFTFRVAVLLAITLFVTARYLPSCIHSHFSESLEVEDGVLEAQCPQPDTLVPSKNADLWNELVKGDYKTKVFLDRAVEWLGGAVRVPTESFDKMGDIGVDPRWEAFGPFHDYLLSAYPQVHATLSLTKVNTYGLVYEWKGTDESLKPLLLAAHQDVVPVNPDTVSEWEHPPFSGFFDGEKIWGRGSSDDKSGLIGILSAAETLIEKGFKPTRSIVLAFGFDEEASGLFGASQLAVHLLATYGENAFAFLVDEGGDYMNEFGQTYATPGIAEKGYLDVRVEVESPGGHSSVPPPHTSIGILSALLVHYESNPYTPRLNRGTPMYLKAQCLASHAPELPSPLRTALIKSTKSDKALREAETYLFSDKFFKSLVGTTQAIDLIQGGVKTNALPESAWGVVNHRIATDSSLSEVKEHDTNLLFDLAQKFNLSYTAFGENLSDDSKAYYGKLTLSDAWGAGLSPAPITPTGLGDDAKPFQLLAGTIKATYDLHRGGDDDKGVVVSPGIMSGNTDTRYYWKLTPHIFRYNHHFTGDTGFFKTVHTVNEYIEADAFIEMIQFFTTLILNTDESTVV